MTRRLLGVMTLALAATGLRFVALEQSPPGFYVDEAAISAQIICVRESGRNFSGQRLPLFSPILGGGFATPTYLYAGVAWTTVFGDSIASFRALAAFIGALTVAGIYFLALALWRDRTVAWLAALCAAISPWAFIFSRIAWDPPLAPCLLVWGLYFLWRSGRRRVLEGALGGVLIALACYTYPPTRLHLALFVPMLLVWTWRSEPTSRPAALAFAASCAVTLVPLGVLTISGELQGRFNELAIWNRQYLQEDFGGYSTLLVVRLFLHNLASNFSPRFLFVHGDAILRHSTQVVGQWSWLELLALVALPALWLSRRLLRDRSDAAKLWLLGIGYLLAVLPAVLTRPNPHSLRSIGAQPFLALLAGYVLARVMVWWRPARIGIPLVAAVFTTFFLYDYFARYPARSRAWFDAAVVDAAARGPDEILRVMPWYPNLAVRYYQLKAGQFTCAR